MMSGFIILTREKSERYIGIDFAGGETAWVDIDVWNELNPANKIDITEKSIFQAEITESVIKYYNWLKAIRSSEYTAALYFTNVLYKLNKFNGFELELLGYDCIYLENDEDGTLSFSLLLHEDELAKYKRDVNLSGLFDSIETATSYIAIRENLLKTGTINLETAFIEYEMKIIATYLVLIP